MTSALPRSGSGPWSSPAGQLVTCCLLQPAPDPDLRATRPPTPDGPSFAGIVVPVRQAIRQVSCRMAWLVPAGSPSASWRVTGCYRGSAGRNAGGAGTGPGLRGCRPVDRLGPWAARTCGRPSAADCLRRFRAFGMTDRNEDRDSESLRSPGRLVPGAGEPRGSAQPVAGRYAPKEPDQRPGRLTRSAPL
jgi:hypothetical protein